MNYLLDPLKGLLCTLFGLLIHPAVALGAVVYAVHFHSYSTTLLMLPCILGIAAILSARWGDPRRSKTRISTRLGLHLVYTR